MDRRDRMHFRHRKERADAKRREKLRELSPVRQWDVMSFWFLATGAALLLTVVMIWFMAFS